MKLKIEKENKVYISNLHVSLRGVVFDIAPKIDLRL